LKPKGQALCLDTIFLEPAGDSPTTRGLKLVAPRPSATAQPAISVDSLRPDYQDRIKQQAAQHLIEPWSRSDLERAKHILPRGQSKQGQKAKLRSGRDNIRFLSARGGFGRFLRRSGTLPHASSITLADSEVGIRDLLRALHTAGILDRASDDNDR